MALMSGHKVVLVNHYAHTTLSVSGKLVDRNVLHQQKSNAYFILQNIAHFFGLKLSSQFLGQSKYVGTLSGLTAL